MQDQAFLGPESGLAVPDGEGGVDLYIATQWLHVDLWQLSESLGLPEEKVRLTMAGVGGAFGGREDLSMQVHACMLALHTGRPVKMVYNREESFFGHVHRHPCTMRYEHGATQDGRPRLRPRAGRARRRRVRLSRRPRSCSNAACFAAGPYDVPNARIDALRDVHEQPAVRRDARLRRGAGRDRPRGADGQARGGARHGPGRAADPQRHGARARSCRPARSCPSRRRWPSCWSACARCRCRPTRATARPRATCASCPAACRTRPTARACDAASATPSASRTSASPRASTTTRPRACACRSTAASRSSRSTRRPPRWGRASSRCRRRSRGPSSASSASRCSPRTRASGSAGSSSASRQT